MKRAILLLILAGCATSGPAIVEHPDKLNFAPLRFVVPDPASMRVTLSTGTPVYLLEDSALPIS